MSFRKPSTSRHMFACWELVFLRSPALCLRLTFPYLWTITGDSAGNGRRKNSAMARMVVEGMLEAAGGGGVMLNLRRGKPRRRKRKELFAIQMCFAAVLLGLAVGLQTVAQKAGEEQSGALLNFLPSTGEHHVQVGFTASQTNMLTLCWGTSHNRNICLQFFSV